MENANVSVQVDASIKKEAEAILQTLGVPVSVAINTLYRQIILRRGLPFPVAMPQRPKAADEMSPEELKEKIMKSYKNALDGNARPFEEVFEELEKKFEE